MCTSWIPQSYEQIAIPQATLAEPLRWTKPSSEVDLLFIDDEPGDMQLPSTVELEVTQTDPGLRGDTASGGGTKPATLETGARSTCRCSWSLGERVKVDTRSGEYVSRA